MLIHKLKVKAGMGKGLIQISRLCNMHVQYINLYSQTNFPKCFKTSFPANPKGLSFWKPEKFVFSITEWTMIVERNGFSFFRREFTPGMKYDWS